MARPRLPQNQTLRGEIYYELCQYALTRNAIPNAHSFWKNVMKPNGYNVTWSTFRDHWKELQIDGLIRIDKVTGATIIVETQVVKKSEMRIRSDFDADT